MRLPANYLAPRIPLDEFLGERTLLRRPDEPELLRRVLDRAREKWPDHQVGCDFERRRPGDDPFPDVDSSSLVVTVWRLLKIVESVQDPEREVAFAKLPDPPRAHLRVGNTWYENVAFVVVPVGWKAWLKSKLN